jgi:hypothetical protein
MIETKSDQNLIPELSEQAKETAVEGEVISGAEAGEIYEATHRGILHIAGADVPCAVLANGKRIISQTGLFQAFDRPRKGEKRQEGLPSIVGAANLLPFVTDELREKSRAIHYVHTNGQLVSGYDAEVIPLVCELYLAANDAEDVLVESQQKIVLRATAMVRALAKVGITALIDEATGYQYDREKDALQKLLKAYIAEDYLKWQTRFPRKYYQEVFRLHKWEYDPQSLKRPQYLGKFTNEFVYKQLPKGVLEELRRKNPVTEKGVRRRRHHQHLSTEVGVPHLDRHLTKLITVMELSDDTESFKKNFNRVFRKVEQLDLGFDGNNSQST